MSTTTNNTGLERGLGLKEAVALNMIDMVGIGPFIVVPSVIADMGGPQALLAWLAGAALALVDGCIWAELGAAMPHAGGSYIFLREAYGPARWGRLMAFLFIWQTLFQAPLVMASAAIGFGEYFQYLFPEPLGPLEERAVRAGMLLFMLLLLYRRITTIGKISLFIWVGVVATIVVLIVGGAIHFDPALAFDFPPGAWDVSALFFAGLGAATVRTIYTYLGYYNVCHLGAEIVQPERNIPRSIFISIAGIAVLYLAMQTSLLGVVPWREGMQSKFIVSTFVERIAPEAIALPAAKVATIMILWIAFGSLYSLALGYSRVPYAAAVDGTFFSVFGRVHPKKHFPHVSLLFLGLTALVFSLLFKLREVISAILAMRILVQFIGGAVGLMLLRARWPAERFPYRMPLYPLPVLLVIAGWIGVYLSTGAVIVRSVQIDLRLASIGMMLLGALIFLVRARIRGEWPFERAEEAKR
jgi:amino acid transporter